MRGSKSEREYVSRAINHKQSKQEAQQQRPCFLDQSGLRVSSFISLLSPFLPSIKPAFISSKDSEPIDEESTEFSPTDKLHCTPPATFRTSGHRTGSVAESFLNFSPSATEAKGCAAKECAANGEGEVAVGECRTPEMIWLRRLACLVARLTARPGKDMMLVVLATLDGRRCCWSTDVSLLLGFVAVVREKQARHGDCGKLARGQRWSIVVLFY